MQRLLLLLLPWNPWSALHARESPRVTTFSKQEAMTKWRQTFKLTFWKCPSPMDFNLTCKAQGKSCHEHKHKYIDHVA
jgi:hypothetical protein